MTSHVTGQKDDGTTVQSAGDWRQLGGEDQLHRQIHEQQVQRRIQNDTRRYVLASSLAGEWAHGDLPPASCSEGGCRYLPLVVPSLAVEPTINIIALN